MKRSSHSRRHRNPHIHDEQHHSPSVQKANETPDQQKVQPFFDATGQATQTKLTVGQPGDKYEQEADAVAESVVNKSSAVPAVQQKKISGIQRSTLMTPEEDEKLSTAEGRMEKDKLIQEMPEADATLDEKEGMVSPMHEEEEVQMQEEEEVQMQEEEEMQMQEEEEEEEVQTKSETTATASPTMASRLQSAKGSGKSLPQNTRQEMESSMGVSFKGVTIHTDTEARELNTELRAQAFTHGKDVYFNAGKYNPDTASGKRLLAHELTHVVQQGKAPAKNPVIQRLDSPGDCTPLEHRQLQDIVNDKCKNYPRSCDASHSLQEIEGRIANNAACIAARKTINAKCFKGGDTGHIEAIDIAVNALMKCYRMKEKIRVPIKEPEPKPIVDPEVAKRIAIATSIGAGLGMVLGGIIGGVGGGAGGTLVAPGVGTVGGGIAGGVAGAAEGAALGGLAGAAVGGGIQSLIEWFSD